MEILNQILSKAGDFVWGVPGMAMLLGTGIYLTILLRGLQFRTLIHSLYLAFIKRKESAEVEGDISHFQALMTALAATVGTGNIAGVATALAAGGPGALFWMWTTGLFGMATKYSEALLAVKYREKDSHGLMSGGPMYYLSKGLKQKWLGVMFAVFASIAAFGIGNMVQSNSVADVLEHSFGIVPWVTGLVLVVATGLVILGGIKSIAKITSFLVPVMIIIYTGCAFYILVLNIKLIPAVFSLIFREAFSPAAVGGGFMGAAMRYGIARGIFSNESGLGSSPIAAAAAQTKMPVTQALVSMTQTFIDTIIVCTLTGTVILMAGLYTEGYDGAELTGASFQQLLPAGGTFIVSISLLLFAYSTILGWSYYGEKSIEFLFGVKAIKPYRIIFVCFVFIGAVLQLQTVWNFSDAMNGMMALPNLIGLLGLSGVIVRETNAYFRE